MSRARHWAEIAVPLAIQRAWPGAQVQKVEYEPHNVCQILDMSCGVDWLVLHRGLVKGLSVRCQGRWAYDYCMNLFGSPTFTIRKDRVGSSYTYESELGKALNASQSQGIRPEYCLHAYMDRDDERATDCVAWGIAHRDELYEWTEGHPQQCKYNHTYDEKRNQKQTFVAVRFDLLPRSILIRQSGRVNENLMLPQYVSRI